MVYQENTCSSVRTCVVECYAINTGIKTTEILKPRIKKKKKNPADLMDPKASLLCSGFSY